MTSWNVVPYNHRLLRKKIKQFIDCLCVVTADCKRSVVTTITLDLCEKGVLILICLVRNMAECCTPLKDCLKCIYSPVLNLIRRVCGLPEEGKYEIVSQTDQDEHEREQRNAVICGLKKELDDTKQEVLHLEQKLRDSEKAKDEALSRLSEHVALKLADNNPNIVDLSDINRPTNLAEKFSTLYDDEWTEAFEVLTDKWELEERKAIQILLEIVEDCFKLCRERSSEQLDQLMSAYQLSRETAPKELLKLTKDARKKHAAVYIPFLQKNITEYLNASKRELIQDESIKAYTKRCIELCWLMAVQDPSMAISTTVSVDTKYDKKRYKEYTKTGEYVDYIVWPCVLIQDGGNLMSKGIAQARSQQEETIVNIE